MLQIAKNIALIFVLPFIIGFVIRLIFHKFDKFYFITIAMAILTAISYIVISNINTHGNEGPIIIAFQLILVTAGLAVAGITNRLIKKTKKFN